MPCVLETRYGRFRVRDASLVPRVVALLRGFCPTGPGGGKDNSCGTGGGRRAKASLVTKREIAAKEIAKEVSAWVAKKAAAGQDMSGAPSEEQIAENWDKVFRARKANEGGKPAFTDLNPERQARVESAVSGLSSNESFSEFADEHGHPLVIFRRAEAGSTAMAEFRGAIHVYDQDRTGGLGSAWPYEREFQAGAYHNAGDYGGYEGVIRHEYGHQLYGTLTREQQSDWIRSSTQISREQRRSELTAYSAENPEELFCEVFAAATDRTAKSKLPAWARDMHEKQREWLLPKGKK